jgi:5-formyltetrahydrofolate cyclo-ligase
MTAPPAEFKRQLRRQFRTILASLTPEVRRVASAEACRLLLQQSAWRQAGTILIYSPRAEELDVRDVARAALESRKSLGLLGFQPIEGCYAARQIRDWPGDLAPGHRGILEPRAHCPALDMKRLDFVLVPGLGFSPDGCRLGSGKGYYDRVLAQIRGFKCGVAFDQQVVDEIPTEPHDVRLDCILTPTRWLPVSRARC